MNLLNIQYKSYKEDSASSVSFFLTSEITTAATCTETGIKTYTATVTFEGETYTDTKTEVISATGHIESEAVTENYAAATCTEDGSYDLVVYCSVCGEELSRETIVIPATGHSYTSEVTDPTRTEKGYTTYTCSDCGDTYIADYVDALGHDYGIRGWTWTEYSSAVATFVCVNDDTHIEEVTAVITSEITTAATCTETGIKTYTATVTFEGETYTDTKTEVIEATGHTEDEAVTENYVEAACTEDGSYDTVIYCSVCGEELRREAIVIPATGHTAKIYTNDKSYHTYTCSQCGETITEEHDFEDGICTICGYEADYSIGLAYTLSDDGTCYTVSGIGTCTDTEIIIPSTYKNLSVTSIGSSAFYGCSSLINITMPNSITSIGTYAFCNCTAEIVWGDNPTITEIGSYAFYGYTGTSITIPDSVIFIGTSAFQYCRSLTEINFNAIAMEDLSSSNYVFYCAGQSGSGITVTIGANVTKIPAYLFCPSYSNYKHAPNITSVVFEDGSVCTSIGSYALWYCTSLISIDIPHNLTSVGEYTFWSCTSLTGVYYSGTASEWASISFGNYYNNPLFYAGNLYLNDTLAADIAIEGVTDIKARAFYGCTSLTSVIIGDSVTTIGNSAFYGCTSLKSITIGSGIETIGYATFSGCTSLKSMTIGSGVTTISNEAFYNCTALTEIYFNATAMEDLSSSNFVFANAGQSSDGITVTIGANVTKMPDYLFSPSLSSDNAPYITSVIFEDCSVCESIGSYAFCYCTLLESITIPDIVTTIGDYAFAYCTSLTSLTIGSGVETIGYAAFYYCTALTEINYNAISADDLSSINWVFGYAGQNGDGITVNIGANVTNIPNYLFCPYAYSIDYSPNLSEVIFKEGSCCLTIGVGSFAANDTLKSITIPNNITSIGKNAFYNCKALTEINFNATAMDDLSSYTYVFQHAGQSGGGITVTIGANVTKIPANLFYYSQYITNVVFEDGSVCESIGTYAFEYCYSIKSITIPDSVMTIGDQAFAYCYSLTSVTV